MAEEKIVAPKYGKEHITKQTKKVVTALVGTKAKTTQHQPIKSHSKVGDIEEAKKHLKINDNQHYGWEWPADPTQEPLFSVVCNALGLTVREAQRFDQNMVCDIGSAVINKYGDNQNVVYKTITNLLKKMPIAGSPIVNLYRYINVEGVKK